MNIFSMVTWYAVRSCTQFRYAVHIILKMGTRVYFLVRLVRIWIVRLVRCVEMEVDVVNLLSKYKKCIDIPIYTLSPSPPFLLQT